MLSQALAGSKSPTGYAQVHAAHRSPVQPQRPAPPVSRTPNRSQPTAVIASPPNKTHRGSSAVLQVLGVAKPDRSSTRSLTPNARSQTAIAQPQDGRNRSQNGRTSPSPSTTSSAFGGARADALSGEIFRSKLQSIMLLREQIEQLAAKHKMEEEALTRVLNSIHFEDDRSDADGVSLVKRTQEELLSAVKERDKTIEMLDTFRREGSAVIQRMHESLRKSAEQNEQLLRQIESLTKENQALKADLGGATSLQSQATVAEYERRAQTYLELLNEGDEVIKELRARNETLVQALASRSAGEPSTVNGGNSDDAKKVAHLQKRVEELQDQLRTEQRARLQSEEQSQIILQEHRRNNELLEQRLAHQSQRDRGGTPRQTIAPQARRSSTSASLSSPLAQIEGQTVPEAQRSVSGVREESRSAPETEAKTVTENPVAPPAEPGEASGSSPVKDTQLSTCRDGDDEQGDDEDDDELEHEENLRHLNDIARQLQSLQATFDSQ